MIWLILSQNPNVPVTRETSDLLVKLAEVNEKSRKGWK